MVSSTPQPSAASQVPPISGTTRVYAVLGDPVVQVMAPRLFNAVFARHGADAVLVPAHVPASALQGFVRHWMTAANFHGLWVTVPHKPACASLVDHRDDAATLAGAVNAVRREADGSLRGALFDGTGFVDALRHFGVPPAGLRVLLLGAGGAGAAIAWALCAAGVQTLALHDLGDRAERLAQRLRLHAPAVHVEVASADPAGFDLVVNATPLGLRAGDPLPVDAQRLPRGCTVVDILMKDHPTPLLRACAERGIAAHAGHEMLVQQVPRYLDFFGLHDVAVAVRDDLASVRALIGAAS